MTIVCYRNGVLCSDSGILKGNIKSGTASKIIKTKSGWLVGAAGDLCAIQKFLKWAKKEPKIRTHQDYVKAFSGLIIKPSGKVIEFYCDGYCRIDSDFVAMGSGAEIATGALAFGASARQAVECTIEYHNECDGKIQELILGE